jgi:hypothetical protein
VKIWVEILKLFEENYLFSPLLMCLFFTACSYVRLDCVLFSDSCSHVSGDRADFSLRKDIKRYIKYLIFGLDF